GDAWLALSFSCVIASRMKRIDMAVSWTSRLPATAPRGPSPFLAHNGPDRETLEGLFELLRQFLDILRRPALDLHAQVQAHVGQDFLDLVQRLAAEVRRAQHVGLGLLHEVADIDDIVVLEAVRGADGKLQLLDL